MARRKKINISDIKIDTKVNPTQFYWCVNCGHHGNFGRLRVRGLQCQKCNYELITEYTKEEIQESDDLSLERFKLDNG